jgi:hypothetical protein
MDDSNLFRLRRWYQDQCDGDWEHSRGVSIDTLDNPGWSLTVHLEDTAAEGQVFNPVKIQRNDENDWVHGKVEGLKFHGHCGPNNLNELLGVFLDWVASTHQ